jgi:hypothetical protein
MTADQPDQGTAEAREDREHQGDAHHTPRSGRVMERSRISRLIRPPARRVTRVPLPGSRGRTARRPGDVRPFPSWRFWQYSPETAPVDLDFYNGSADDLKAWLATL